MTELFEIKERLYRAVYPPNIMPMFWKENGRLSSAVFKDRKGLSVERGGDRREAAVLKYMRRLFSGNIISITVGECYECRAKVRYLPSYRSQYHSEIHGSDDKKLLSQTQCKYLADRAIILFESV